MDDYDDVSISGPRVTPENADLFPLPRCCAQGYGSGGGGGRTRSTDRTEDLRGFRCDPVTPFIADAFLRNSPFDYPKRTFETCKAMVRRRCSKKKPKKPARKKSPYVQSLQREIKLLKAKLYSTDRLDLPRILGECFHPDAQTRGQPPRTWKACERCGLNFDFQGDWTSRGS